MSGNNSGSDTFVIIDDTFNNTQDDRQIKKKDFVNLFSSCYDSKQHFGHETAIRFGRK